MQSLISFLEMGGYAGFVWPSYAITAIVMIGLLVVTLRDLRDKERSLAALEAARPRRRRRGGKDDRGGTA